MSIYLKQFSTHAEYEAYITSEDKVLPNVSICTTEGDVHYNPWVDTRVVAKYNVTDTSNPTVITKAPIRFSAIEIDGVVQPSVVSAYTFDTIGEHTVKYTLTDPTSIGDYVFDGCTNLISVDIPNSVTYIGSYAINYCPSLTSITIPSGVTYIGNGAFAQCKSLTSIAIPSGVTYIGNGAFAQCKSLTSIVCDATTAPTIQNDTFNNTNNCPIYVPSGSVDAYKAASGWSNYASRIQAIP